MPHSMLRRYDDKTSGMDAENAPEASGWALALSRPQCEMRASRDLNRLGIKHRLFRLRQRRAYRGRIIVHLIPAFRRYIFVPYTTCISVLRSAWNLVGIIHYEEGPALVRQEVVDDLASRCGNGDDVLDEEFDSGLVLHRGDGVEIVGYGPLSGQQAMFDAACDDGRAIVMLPWFGSAVSASVNMADLILSQKSKEQKLNNGNRKRRRRHRRSSRMSGGIVC